MGNPTSYYNGTRWAFTWQNGRELTRATKTGTEVNYTYDADGMRKTKTVNGVTHTYYYTGGKLLREVYDGTILDFFYNANGTPIAMRQSAVGSTNYTIYYYITNLQGDVIRLVDHLGQTAAYYRYDPYGKVIEASGSHANINPLRYRGYYYDVETELYYLQSRYYDPQIGRFINADSYASTGQGVLGNNMFAYCGNNPITGYDPTGHWDFWGVLSGLTLMVVGAAIIAASATTSPLLVPAGASVGVALMETGAAVSYAAATDSTAVIDASYTNGSTGEKYGCSVVIDYEDKTTEVYTHYGETTSSSYSVTYGSGVVFNYDGEGSYGGTFVDASMSTNRNGVDYGIDACFSPGIIAGEDGTAAIMGTVGYSLPAIGRSDDIAFGLDHYDSIYFASWG